MRKATIALLVLGASLLLAPSAIGAIRFAGPGGMGVEPCASPANPCSIFRAADASSGAALGDEVILAPGEYSDTAGDLGTTGIVSFEPGISVHGAFGTPRPLITLENPSIMPITVNDGDVVSHLEIVTEVAKTTIAVEGGVLEDTIARSSTNGTNAIDVFACLHLGGIIRNSACVSSGDGADALAGFVILLAGASRTLRLRSVTAVATGQGGVGIDYGGQRGDLIVDASSVMASGPSFDVQAVFLEPNANVRINLDHSNYRLIGTVGLTRPERVITAPDEEGNVSQAPRLAPDGIHQLPDSPTIDRGAVDQFSGAAIDIDGEPRTLGAAPDIGADELVPPPRPPVVQPPVAQPPSAGPPAGGGGPVTRPAPTTRIGRHPGKQTAIRSAAFSFTSNKAGATFECKLDRSPFKRCSSSYRTTVKPGRHTFRVRALSGGTADPTPATFSWEVSRPPRGIR